MNKKKLFIAIAVFWIIIIGGFIAFKEYTLQTGNEVLLKTVPVDPRDLFRGDYVILSYDISTIEAGKYTFATADFKEGDKIFVSLNVDDDHKGSVADIHKQKPESGIFIKGDVLSVSSSRLRIKYGIESYFVPEGKGREIERKLRKMYTKVAIDDFGNAVIKALVLDGKEIDLD